MPHELAEQNLRLFAEKCLATLKHDEAFCVPVIPAGELDTSEKTHEDVFAPA